MSTLDFFMILAMGFFIGLPVGVAVELLRIRMFGNPWE